MIADLIRAITCAHDLTLLVEIKGEEMLVDKRLWCARLQQDWPTATEEQCAGLYLFLIDELVLSGSLRCSVWQLAHAIEHELVKGDMEGTRH